LRFQELSEDAGQGINGPVWYCVSIFHAVQNLGQGDASQKDLDQVIDLAAATLRSPT
jgi:hypothetical protein